MSTTVYAPRIRGGDLFLKVIATADPATNRPAELLVDTNVVLELMSFGDLIAEGDKHRDVLELMLLGDFGHEGNSARRSAESAWRSPAYRHRQLRARASILLMWILAERGLVTAMLGKEVFDIMDKVSPIPGGTRYSLLSDVTSYALTKAIVNTVYPMLISHGLCLGALTDVNHRARGNKADAELLRLAKSDSLLIISNEGYTLNGLSDFKSDGSKSLRGLGRDIGVKVYSPKEYLGLLRVDMKREAQRFIQACERPLIEEYLRASSQGSSLLRRLYEILHHAVENNGYIAHLERMIPLYRFILLDERDEALEGVQPPPVC